MRLNTDSSDTGFRFTGQHAVLVLLVIGTIAAGWYVWGVWSRMTGGIPATPSERAVTNRPPRPSPEERRERRRQMYAEVGVTPEQIERIENLPEAKTREDRRKQRDEINKILTDEQREKLRENMRARMAQRREEMMKGLSPADRAALEKRFEERRGRWGRGRGGGGSGERPPRERN